MKRTPKFLVRMTKSQVFINQSETHRQDWEIWKQIKVSLKSVETLRVGAGERDRLAITAVLSEYPRQLLRPRETPATETPGIDDPAPRERVKRSVTDSGRPAWRRGTGEKQSCQDEEHRKRHRRDVALLRRVLTKY